MYKRIFIIILIVCILISISLLTKQGKANITNYKNIEQNIHYFQKNIYHNADEYKKYIKDRYVKITSTSISIGKNKNEVENEYYDVYIKIANSYIVVYINKLFKEFDKTRLYDEIYVDQIIEYINILFDFKFVKKELYDCITLNYESLRDIDRNNVESVDKKVQISGNNILITTYDNMLLLKIGDE